MHSPKPALPHGQKRILTIFGVLAAAGCTSSATQQGTGGNLGSAGGTESKANASFSTSTRSSTVSTTANPSRGGSSGSLNSSGGEDTAPSSTVGGFGNGGSASRANASGGTTEADRTASNTGASNQGGTATTSDASRGGTSARRSTSSSGGASATSGTAPKGGTSATGGSSTRASSGTPGGSSAKGGTGAIGGSTNGGNELCDVGKWDGTTKPVPLTLSGNTFAHDPTMIAANGTYYRFWTGDNIPSAKSTNLTNWQNASAVFKNGYSAWVDEWLAGVSGETFNFPWAPDVSYFNGQYHLYSTFSAKFGDNISCITHLTTADIAAGNWTDHGPVICTKGSENYNAIDADLGIDASGAPWLAFGSFWDGIMGMSLNPDGSSAGNKLTRLAWANEIEAPVLFYRCGYYYLFVTWGLCCPGEGRSVSQLTYRVAVGRSKSIMGPYVDRSGKAMLDGGGTLMVQGDKTTWAAAGHSDVMVSGDKIYHLYHAYRQSNGEAQLRIVEMPFDSEQWPVPAGP